MMWLIEVAGWILKWTDLYSAETRQMMQMDNFPKHTTNARVSQEQRNWIRFNCQVRHFKLKPIEDLFKLLNRKLKTDRPIRKQQVKAATVKAQHGTSRGKTQKTFTLFGRIVWHLTPQLEVVCVDYCVIVNRLLLLFLQMQNFWTYHLLHLLSEASFCVCLFFNIF